MLWVIVSFSVTFGPRFDAYIFSANDGSLQQYSRRKLKGNVMIQAPFLRLLHRSIYVHIRSVRTRFWLIRRRPIDVFMMILFSKFYKHKFITHPFNIFSYFVEPKIGS